MKTRTHTVLNPKAGTHISCKTRLKAAQRSVALVIVVNSLGSAALAAPLPVVAQVEAHLPGVEGQQIDKITVVGLKTLGQSAVLVMSGLQTGDKCSEQTLELAKSRLIKAGLFGMHNLDDQDEWVRFRVETKGYARGHCELLILVDENDVITAATITGSGPVSTSEILGKLHVGSLYNSEQMERDRRAIQDIYSTRGYVASFGQELGVDPGHPGILNVPIVVARVRDIKISGNHSTRAFVIRRQLKTSEGGYFNRKVLSQDIKRMADLGLFSDLDPSVSVVTPEQVSVDLKVTERKARTYNFGSSYGGGVLAGFVEVSDNNFRGQDEALGIHIENGIGSGRHMYQASFVEPNIDRKSTALTINAFDTSSSMFSTGVLNVGSTNSAGSLVQQKAGGSVQFTRPLSSGFAVQAMFKGESIRTDPLSLAGSSAALLQDGQLTTASTTFSHSTLDQHKEPSTGSLQAVTIGVGHADLHTAILASDPASQAAAGSHNFARTSFEVQKYINLQQPRREGHPDDERSTVAMRFQAASITGTSPFSEQFFLGGSSGLRGYRDGRFWGQNMTAGTVELRHPLSKGFKGVLFAEAGDAWGGPYQGVSLQGLQQSGFKVHGSTGFGVRLGTPVGLVRLDYGYGTEGGRVHFGIGHSF